MEEFSSSKEQKTFQLPGIFVSAIFFLILMIFEITLIRTQLLPNKYVLYLTGILLLLAVIVALLVWNFHNRIRFFIGTALVVLITAAFMVGGSYIQKTSETLGNITSVKTEISQVAVFVKAENPAENITDLSAYTFGILEFLDRENTDQAIKDITAELNQEIETKSYMGPGEIIDGLLNEEVGAVIMNQAYMDIIEEMEGYEGCSEKLRLLEVRHVETIKKVASPKPTENTSLNNMENSNSDDMNVAADDSGEMEPDAAESDTAESGAAELDITELDTTELDVTEPDTTESGLTENDVLQEESSISESEKQDTKEASNLRKKGEIISVYISGIDTYGDVSAKSRSDVNIIATVNTGTKQVLLVSTPRDYFVPLSISNGIPDKLTHAGIYGIDVSKDTLGMLYDIEIPYYFRVNFSGFSGIIDALGGITVHSDYDFTAGQYSYHVGENHLNGEQALAFARERYSFSEGDRQRGRNQMAVIKAVIQKAVSTELLKNFSSILKAVEGTFETSIPMTTITSLISAQLDEGGEWNIVMYSVDGTGDKQKPYSMSQNAYVMIPDQTTVEKAKELMRQVRDGEVISLDE